MRSGLSTTCTTLLSQSERSYAQRWRDSCLRGTPSTPQSARSCRHVSAAPPAATTRVARRTSSVATTVRRCRLWRALTSTNRSAPAQRWCASTAACARSGAVSGSREAQAAPSDAIRMVARRVDEQAHEGRARGEEGSAMSLASPRGWRAVWGCTEWAWRRRKELHGALGVDRRAPSVRISPRRRHSRANARSPPPTLRTTNQSSAEAAGTSASFLLALPSAAAASFGVAGSSAAPSASARLATSFTSASSAIRPG